LSHGQRRPSVFGNHDVQQGVEIVAAHIVLAREVATYPIRLCRDRPHVGRHQLLKLWPVGR
jgi:hypothetical protein